MSTSSKSKTEKPPPKHDDSKLSTYVRIINKDGKTKASGPVKSFTVNQQTAERKTLTSTTSTDGGSALAVQPTSMKMSSPTMNFSVMDNPATKSTSMTLMSKSPPGEPYKQTRVRVSRRRRSSATPAITPATTAIISPITSHVTSPVSSRVSSPATSPILSRVNSLQVPSNATSQVNSPLTSNVNSPVTSQVTSPATSQGNSISQRVSWRQNLVSPHLKGDLTDEPDNLQKVLYSRFPSDCSYRPDKAVVICDNGRGRQPNLIAIQEASVVTYREFFPEFKCCSVRRRLEKNTPSDLQIENRMLVYDMSHLESVKIFMQSLRMEN